MLDGEFQIKAAVREKFHSRFNYPQKQTLKNTP
jgi:hypothetical protein